MTCKVDGCGRPVKNRGWCCAHYRRVLRHGDPQEHVPLRRQYGTGWIDALGYHRRKIDNKMHFVHRLVMENTLGRSLRDDENVHHRNGDRLDNRPENLELWVNKQPRGARPEDLIPWALEILDRYAPHLTVKEPQ